jgi:plastocyanin
MNNKKIFCLISIVITIALVTATSYHWGAATIVAYAASSNSPEGSISIKAGSGNSTAPLTTFTPQKIEIKKGDTVRWYNPTQVGEPHTVTFVLDNKTMTGFAVPFGVASSAQFMSIPPNSNSEPVSIPGKGATKTIVAINSRVYNPAVIDSANNPKTLGPNATYVFNGNEKYVNSGFLLPKGQDKNYPGSSNTFTVTFQNPGIYRYLCIIHPWMTGEITVR